MPSPKLNNYIRFGAHSGLNLGSASGALNMTINAADEKVAFKFYATNTSAITDIDVNVNINGDVTGVNFKIQIETDNAGVPSGSVLGADTPSFAGPAADGWIGLQTLDTNTGALTLNTPYWVVLYEDGTGSDPDGSNWLQIYEAGTAYGLCGEIMRHHDATNWTNTTLRGEPGLFVVKHSDGSYSGFVLDSVSSTNTHTDIYDTNRQGIKVTFGSKVTIQGFFVNMDRINSPGNVTVKLYEGSTQRAVSNAVASTEIGDRGNFIFWFTTPYETSGDSVIYVTVEQDGGDDNNDWSFMSEGYSQTAYKECAVPANFDFIYGSGADPTGYAVSDEWVPRCALIFTDPATEFDEGASGGGGGGNNWYPGG